MNASARFREVQRFTQPWIWAALAASSAVPIWMTVQHVATGRVFG